MQAALNTPSVSHAAPSDAPASQNAPAATANTFTHYQIIRRNGAVVPFEPQKIAVAMMKAFLAVHGTQGAASASVREVVETLTQNVSRALMRSRPGGGTFHIEDVQDQVELGLMRGGHHEIARAYVLYRERRTQERAHLQFEAEVMRALILPDLIEIGHMNPGRWQRMAEAFHELGMVADTQALSGFIYDPNPRTQVERLQKIIALISLGAGLVLLIALLLLASQRRLRREIQRRQLAEEEVRNLAFNDSLTGLPNRNSFIPYARQKLLSAKRSGECLALCYIDLNQFKQINDAYGHQAGDAILIHAAQAISAHIRKADMAARMGGDEFVILLDGVHSDVDIQHLTSQICRAIAVPLRWRDCQLQVSASLGIAIYPRDGEELDELMSKADSAMFMQKAAMLMLR